MDDKKQQQVHAALSAGVRRISPAERIVVTKGQGRAVIVRNGWSESGPCRYAYAVSAKRVTGRPKGVRGNKYFTKQSGQFSGRKTRARALQEYQAGLRAENRLPRASLRLQVRQTEFR